MATISATIKIMDGFSAPLDKLSNGLKSSQSAMSNLKSAISSANPFSSLNKDAGQTGGIFKSVLGGNIIGSGITKGISTVTSGLGGMVGDLNEASATWQTFNGNMAMLGKGPKEIAATRDDLTKFAQQTIYSASDMASTYSQLAAVGIKGTDKLVKGFGGLASAAKDPQQAMKTLSQQATQAAAKPQIQWQDFKLMLEQTPAGMAAVAKTMGMSTSDLVKSVQDGKIATQDFFDAIAKTGTNADFTKMATQYKTMGQAMAGFRETLTTSLQPAWDKLSQVGIKAISGITDKIGEVDFSALGDKLVSALDTAKKGLTAFWDSFKDTGALTFLETAFKSIGTAAQSVFENLSKGSKDKDPFSFLKGLGTGIGNTLKGLARGISAVSTAIGEMDPDDLKLLGTALLVLKGGMKGIVFTAVVAGLKALGKLDVDQLNGLAKAVTSLAAAFAVIKAGMKIGKGVSKVSDIFGSLGKGGKTPELPIPDSGKSGKSAGNLIKMGGALLMIGGAVLLAGAGFALLASGIAKIAKTGSTGIGILIGLGVALLVLLVAVRLLGPGLIAGAVGFLIFGAALLLIGVAVFLASAGIALLAEQLPMLSKYGAGAAQGLSLLALAVGLFGLMSIIAAVGLVLLAVALIALGVGFIVAAVGALLFGVALVLVAVFGILAAVGLILLGVALLLVTVFSLTAAIGMLLLGVAVLLVAVFGIIAAVGMLLLGVALALVMVFAIIAAVGMILLGVSLILVMAFAIVAAVGLILLGVALMLVMVFGIVAAVGLLLLGVALVLVAVMALLGAVGMLLMAVALIMIAAVAMVAAVGMLLLGVALMIAAPMMLLAAVGALLLGVAAIILAVGLLLVGAALLLVAAGLSAAASGVMALASAFVSAGSMLVGAIVGAMQNVGSSVKTGISNAVNAAKGFGSSLVSVGKDLIQGLVNGIKSMIGSAVSAVKSVASSVVNAAKSILHIGSPSKLFDQYGQWVVEGLANGLNGSAGLAANASGDMAKGVVNAASGMSLPDIAAGNIGSPQGLTAGDQMAAGFNRALDSISNVQAAMNGLAGNTTLGINGQVTDDTAPSTSPFNGSGGSSSQTTNNSQASNSSNVTIESGAIQINSSGNADYDADRLLTIIENRIVELNNASLGGA